MKGYPLDKEISIPELLQMRENGMSNPEIAEALDVSPNTISRYIGRGPRSKNRNRGGGAPVAAEIKNEEPVEACLKVETAAIGLTGAYGQYTIDERQDAVYIIAEAGGHELSGYIPVDQLAIFARELKAIERNIDKVKLRLEVW